MWQPPKDDSLFTWTVHAGIKMRFYGLSANKVRNVIRHPERTEEAIVEGAAAVMRRAGTKSNPTEVWAMYVPTRSPSGRKIRVITAWRYPGISKTRGPVPIPPDILRELEELLK